MSIRYIKSFLIIVVLFSRPILSVCPEMEVWSDGTNYRYLMKDSHVDYIDGRISIKQQSDIIWAAQQKNMSEVFILAEDAWSYSGSNKKIHDIKNGYSIVTLQNVIKELQWHNRIEPEAARGSMKIMNATPLLCLTYACQESGVRCYNTECNQSINIYQSLNLPANLKVNKEDVIGDLAEGIAAIGYYPELQEFHTLLCEQLEKLKKIVFNNNENEFISEAYEVRYVLVNAKILHKLTEWRNVKHGFIFQGKGHIENIKAALKDLRYKYIKSIGNGSVWVLSRDTPELLLDSQKQELKNALDLGKEFRLLFEEQSKQKLIRFCLYLL